MKENQNDPRNQDKTGNQSNQKPAQGSNKKETNLNRITEDPKQQDGAKKQDGTRSQNQDKKNTNIQGTQKKA